MGKSWDEFEPKEYQEFCEEWGREALRVLKPGAYLLAFSGTRTYHRMVTGLEDAGFEIKDFIAYMYGSGFPKSLSVVKQIWKRLKKCLLKEYALLAVQNSKLIPVESSVEKENIVVASAVILPEESPALIIQIGEGEDSNVAMVTSWSGLAENIDWSIVSSWKKSWKDPSEIMNKSTTKTEIEQITDRKTWNSILSQNIQVKNTRVKINQNGLKLPVLIAEKNSSGEKRKSKDIPILSVLGNATLKELLKHLEGTGTALKPSIEPIVLAQKPRDGTYAEQVLEYGVGALNIDGCRIGEDIDTAVEGGPNNEKNYTENKRREKYEVQKLGGVARECGAGS